MEAKGTKSKLLLYMLGIFFLLCTTKLQAAQIKSLNEIEISCRSKAKEEAAFIFKNCLSESKTAQIELIKKDYQEKLKGIKEFYEKELRKLSSKGNKSGKSEKIETAQKAQVESSRPENNSRSEISIDLKPNTELKIHKEIDDSVMDIPEPMPVENL